MTRRASLRRRPGHAVREAERTRVHADAQACLDAVDGNQYYALEVLADWYHERRAAIYQLADLAARNLPAPGPSARRMATPAPRREQ